jgi:hypothetical protein
MLDLDSILGPATITDAQADVYVTIGNYPGRSQGGQGGRRSDHTQVYASVELQIVSGDGRPSATPAIKAYEADGHGADAVAIAHFLRTGCFDFRAYCNGHGKEAM